MMSLGFLGYTMFNKYYSLCLFYAIGRDLDTPDVREPLRQVNVDFPHEIGHMVAAYGTILEGKLVCTDIKQIVPFTKNAFVK
jgi:hypothetical protein